MRCYCIGMFLQQSRMQIWTERDCGSIYKTCKSSSQTRCHHWGGEGGHSVSHLSKKLLQLIFTSKNKTKQKKQFFLMQWHCVYHSKAVLFSVRVWEHNTNSMFPLVDIFFGLFLPFLILLILLIVPFDVNYLVFILFVCFILERKCEVEWVGSGKGLWAVREEETIWSKYLIREKSRKLVIFRSVTEKLLLFPTNIAIKVKK